jgi:hypothetical protein
MPVLPALRLRQPDVWCFTWRNCIIYFWQRITLESLRATHELTQELRPTFPRGIVTVSCSMPDSPLLPSADARAEALRLMGDMRGFLLASAGVREGSGLLMTAARAFISTLTIVANRSEQRFRLFSSIDKVAPWLAPLMEPGGTDPGLVAELGDALVRARTIRGGADSKPADRGSVGIKPGL